MEFCALAYTPGVEKVKRGEKELGFSSSDEDIYEPIDLVDLFSRNGLLDR